MKKYLIITAIFIFILLLIGCPAQSSKSGGGDSGSSGSLSVGTGTVSGTVNDDAEVTITQSDGTTQTTTTSQNNPDFIFEDVPEGEATVEVTTSEGTTSQEVQVVEGETTEVNPFGSTQEMDNSLTAHVYIVDRIYNNRETTANINTSNSLGIEFYSKEINVPKRAFDEGFPGITDRFEWFGVVYEGKITAPANGKYTFKLTCDDGAVLYLDDKIVVDGDGVHDTQSFQGTVDLVAGQEYDFLLKYFQGPRYEITCVLQAQIPGEDMKLFDMDDF